MEDLTKQLKELYERNVPKVKSQCESVWLSTGADQYWAQEEVRLTGAFVCGVVLGLLLPRLRRPFRRYLTVDDVPNSFFQREGQLKGRVVKISDGDTFRLRHTPLWRGVGKMDGKLSENTMQIRLAAIDTPETAKFGNQGQPFGDEAKQWLTDALTDKDLTITFLSKDQYSRAVCKVEYGMWPFRRNASKEILKAGLATVYRQSGAVYGGDQEVYEKIEAKAKKQKKKIWSQKSIETAAEYKARTRAAAN